MNPLVTVVTPVYNAMPYLPEYLNCLKQQTWRPMSVILVDDGSTDTSAECLLREEEALKQVGLSVRIIRASHCGQAAAMNLALPFIEGEYFTWCDADDVLTPDSVEKKVRWLMEHPEIGMVRSDGIVLDADLGVVLSHSAKERDRCQKSVFEDLFMDRTYCYAGCYMVRTSLFFACYPEKKMPESPEGQNLQLLLPPASRTQCGFIAETLHTYCRRKSGHSSMQRSYQETLRRMKNFTALRLEILDYCECDRAHYEALAKELEEKNRQMLLYGAVQRARKELKHEHRDIDIS